MTQKNVTQKEEWRRTKHTALLQGARCDLCPLKVEGIPVFAKPNAKAKLVVVGEGPGKTEERLGEPFTGISGKLLDTTLAESKFSRGNAYVTNAALCRGESDRDNERAAECCTPRLLAELVSLPAKLVTLTLGKTAFRAVLGRKNVMKARGFVWTTPEVLFARIKAESRKAAKSRRPEDMLRAETLAARGKIAGRNVVPSIHPAFVLRADVWHPILQIDIRRAIRLARGEILRLEHDGTAEVGGPEILRGLGDVVSCDVETDSILPLEAALLCVGLSSINRKGVLTTKVIFPWKPAYAKKLARFLGSRKQVVFHNGWQYDLLVMRKNGVIW